MNRSARTELVHAIHSLHPGDPYFIEERVARWRGRFWRAVKDVAPGQTWWELCYFYSHDGACWAYLPASRSDHSAWGWGYTATQAYLNSILLHCSTS
ncbi:MAG: hypothetical protein OHK0012_24820 [Synechococcales cyanobacterium]